MASRTWILMFHYGGTFCYKDGADMPSAYTAGKKMLVGEVQWDKMSMFEVQWHLSKINHPKSSQLFYKVPGGRCRNNIRQLKSDGDVLEMLNAFDYQQIITVIVVPPDGQCDWVVAPECPSEVNDSRTEVGTTSDVIEDNGPTNDGADGIGPQLNGLSIGGSNDEDINGSDGGVTDLTLVEDPQQVNGGDVSIPKVLATEIPIDKDTTSTVHRGENGGTNVPNWDDYLGDVVFSDNAYVNISVGVDERQLPSCGIVIREGGGSCRKDTEQGNMPAQEATVGSVVDKGKRPMVEPEEAEDSSDSDDDRRVDPSLFIDSDEEVEEYEEDESDPEEEEDQEGEAGGKSKSRKTEASTSRAFPENGNDIVYGPHLEHHYTEQDPEDELPSEDELDGSSADDMEQDPEFVPKIKKLCISGYGPWRPPFRFRDEMKFQNNRVAREYLRQYAAKEWYDIKCKKNERTRITAECQPGCTWRLHASSVQGSEELYARVY